MHSQRTLRMTALAAAALAWSVLAAPAALAQGGDVLVNEVMRKGKEGEAENGFCATTPWPTERSTADTGNFYEQAQIGTAKAFKDTYSGRIPYCAYIYIGNVTQEGDGRCVHAQMWWCHFGQQCHYRQYRGCRGATGPYTWDN